MILRLMVILLIASISLTNAFESRAGERRRGNSTPSCATCQSTQIVSQSPPLRSVTAQSRVVADSGIQSATLRKAGISSCNCYPGTGGNCQAHPNCLFSVDPAILGSNTTSTPIKVEPPGPCTEATLVTIPFYDKDIPTTATIPLPQKTKRCIETYLFERKSYQVCGCTVNVCVPCSIECKNEERCETVDTNVEVIVRVRHPAASANPVADIWAKGVKGLPNPAVLALSLNLAQVRTFLKNPAFVF
jgi:hypothetical protein